jgi:uncharacterized membrane protein
MSTAHALWADKQGSMAITMAGILFLLMALSALFIDLGSLYLTRQRLQGAVDSAALKAASNPAQAQELATEIITANIADAGRISVEPGRYTPTALPVAQRFEPTTNDANALRVSARARAPLYFAMLFGVTDGWVSARAVALNQPLTQIMASTQFADLSTLPAQIPNALLTALTGVPVSLGPSDYDALSDASVDILAFLDNLLAIAGMDAGDYDGILAAPVTPAEILEAASQALDGDGIQALASLESQWAGLGGLTLDALLALDPQSPKASAGARLDLFNLVLGTALALNQQGGIISHANLDLGLARAILYVSVVRPPRYSAIGGVGTRVETAQVRLFLDTRTVALKGITLSIPPLLTVSLQSNISLPVYVTQGMGEAEVTAITCPSSDANGASVAVRATPGLLSTRVGTVLPAALHGMLAPPVSPATLFSASAAGISINVTASADLDIKGSAHDLTFTAPFTAENQQAVPLDGPGDHLATRLRAGLTPEISLGGSSLLGLVTGLLTPVLNGTLNLLAPLVDTTIMQLQSLFSLDQGYMTVADTYLRCGRPLLAQ